MDNFDKLKTSVEKVSTDVVETTRELELGLEPEDVTELLQFHEMKFITSIPGEDVMKIVEMTTRDLEQYINLVDKAVAGFDYIDSVRQLEQEKGVHNGGGQKAKKGKSP